MKRPLVNYLLDWIGLLLFAGLVATGFLLHFTLPHGSGNATVLSLGRHDWGAVHFWVSVGFVTAIMVHLLLHANWIKALTLGKASPSGRLLRGGLATALCLALVALGIALVFAPVSPGEPQARGEGRNQAVLQDHGPDSQQIDRPRRGRMANNQEHPRQPG
jgi:hypothetical protein